MNEFMSYDPDAEARAAAWQADRQVEAAPLPGSERSHYTGESQRQSALESAEDANVARAAGSIGLTSVEWREIRRDIKRTPGPADAEKYLKNR